MGSVFPHGCIKNEDKTGPGGCAAPLTRPLCQGVREFESAAAKQRVRSTNGGVQGSQVLPLAPDIHASG